MVTLLDVAKRANVSKMTVSRVINHPEQVSEELQELVFDSMKALNYKPNAAARALANNRSNVIKVYILENVNTVEPYYMNLIMGIARELEKHQYALQLVTQKIKDNVACDGVIITGMRDDDYQWVSNMKVPVVIFGENKYGYDSVDCNNKLGTELSTKYAIDCGYENIVFIGMDIDEPFEIARESGYEKIMKQSGLPSKIYRFKNQSRYSSAFIRENFETIQKSTCFVCSTDRLALGVVREIVTKGGDIPVDFGVIGFDGVFLDQMTSPQLTTVKQATIEMGMACAKMLLKKIEQGGKDQGSNLFDPKLIIRESTK